MPIPIPEFGGPPRGVRRPRRAGIWRARAGAPGYALRAPSGGSIIIVGSTASRRGVARTAAFAPAKAAQRSLAESMARHLWPQNIHVALIILDGIVDSPRSRAAKADTSADSFVSPEAVADTAFHLATQHASAWSFEVEARPFNEPW